MWRFAFSSHIYYRFSDLHDNVFSRRFIVFANSSTNTAIFDFAETTFCTRFSNFSSFMWHDGSWMLLIHIVKQENVRHPILCSVRTENTVENRSKTVILSKKQWYNAVTPRDPRLHHWFYKARTGVARPHNHRRNLRRYERYWYPIFNWGVPYPHFSGRKGEEFVEFAVTCQQRRSAEIKLQ